MARPKAALTIRDEQIKKLEKEILVIEQKILDLEEDIAQNGLTEIIEGSRIKRDVHFQKKELENRKDKLILTITKLTNQYEMGNAKKQKVKIDSDKKGTSGNDLSDYEDIDFFG